MSNAITAALQLDKCVVDKAYDMVMMFDPQTLQFLYGNEMVLSQSGYTKAELLQLKISDLNPEFTIDNLRKKLHPLYAGSINCIHTAACVFLKHGKRLSVEVYLELMVKESLCMVICLARDITKRQQIADKIRILSRAVEQSASTVVITDNQGNIEYVNPSFEKLTGYTALEVIGKTPRILKSGEQPDFVYRELWKTITAGGEWRGEFHNKKKSQELFWESACISAVRDDQGQITHFLAVKEDITQKKAAQQAAERAHATLNEIFNVVGDGLVVVDINFNIIKANEAFLKIFEVTRQEVIGNKCYEIILCPNCHDQKCDMAQALKGKKRIEFDMERTGRNGKRTSLIVTVTPFHNIGGQAMGIVANIKDVTARRKVSERLRKDFMLAGKIQSGFLPAEIENDLFRVKNIYKPVHHVGGDFLEYKWDEQRQVLFGCIVDIMGHGMSAALQTSALRVLIRQTAECSCSLAHKLANINRQSVPYFAEDSLAAAIYFEVDFKSRQLRYSSGGINYFLRIVNGKQEVVKVPGSLLGVMPDSTYEEHCIHFDQGESFLFLSDGLYDVLPGKVDSNINFDNAYSQLLNLATVCRDDASAICLEIKN